MKKKRSKTPTRWLTGLPANADIPFSIDHGDKNPSPVSLATLER